jgi:hypothetical protein
MPRNRKPRTAPRLVESQRCVVPRGAAAWHPLPSSVGRLQPSGTRRWALPFWCPDCLPPHFGRGRISGIALRGPNDGSANAMSGLWKDSKRPAEHEGRNRQPHKVLGGLVVHEICHAVSTPASGSTATSTWPLFASQRLAAARSRKQSWGQIIGTAHGLLLGPQGDRHIFLAGAANEPVPGL